MSDPGWATLPCGMSPAPLLTHAIDRTAPAVGSHAATCPYCRAAIDELAERWRPVTEWARRDIRLPEGFLGTLVARVRRMVQSPHHVATTGLRGTTTVTSWVLGLIASAAARGTPGVAAVSGVPASARHRGAVRDSADGIAVAEAGAAGVTVSIGIRASLTASLGTSGLAATDPSSGLDLAGLADVVRHRVMAAIDAHTAIQADEVDITVEDLEL